MFGLLNQLGIIARFMAQARRIQYERQSIPRYSQSMTKQQEFEVSRLEKKRSEVLRQI